MLDNMSLVLLCRFRWCRNQKPPRRCLYKYLINSVIYETEGNVGVGVTSPSVKLEVGGPVLIPNQNYFMTKSADQTAITTFGLDGSDRLHIGSGNKIVGIQLDTGGAFGWNSMYVANGKVGISILYSRYVLPSLDPVSPDLHKEQKKILICLRWFLHPLPSKHKGRRQTGRAAVLPPAESELPASGLFRC